MKLMNCLNSSWRLKFCEEFCVMWVFVCCRRRDGCRCRADHQVHHTGRPGQRRTAAGWLQHWGTTMFYCSSDNNNANKRKEKQQKCTSVWLEFISLQDEFHSCAELTAVKIIFKSTTLFFWSKPVSMPTAWHKTWGVLMCLSECTEVDLSSFK